MNYLNRFACLLAVLFMCVVMASPVMAETYTFSGEFHSSGPGDIPIQAGDSFEGSITYAPNPLCSYVEGCIFISSFSFVSGDRTYSLDDFKSTSSGNLETSWDRLGSDGEQEFQVVLQGEADYYLGTLAQYLMSIQYYDWDDDGWKEPGLIMGFGTLGTSTGYITGGTICEKLSCQSTEDDVVPGNQSCEDLGLGSLEYKVDFDEPVVGGEYSIDGVNTVTISNIVDGKYFDWSSTLPLDAVLVKGGPNTKVWTYDPEATSGFGLIAPINNDSPYGLSHVSFCYDYEVGVSKTADTSYLHSCEWDIEKTADAEYLTLAVGQQYQVNYTVDVGLGCFDSDHAVTGSIEIHNPAPHLDATILDVVDLMDGVSVDVVCGVDFPYTLPGGATLTCSYSSDLEDGLSRTNVATVTTEGPVLGGSGSVLVDFESAAISYFDECVIVEDSLAGTLSPPEMLCEENAPKSYMYSEYVGPYAECDTNHLVENIAGLITNDSGTIAEDSWTVYITTPPCGYGCTLTPGYWKTHSEYGPAPYDDAWADLSDGADTLFYGSGQSYYDVLWTPPKNGNAYYILAHAYIAAYMNDLNGADMTAVFAEMARAEELFLLYGPSVSKKVGKEFKSIAIVLDDFNNGLLGPGHCDLDVQSVQ